LRNRRANATLSLGRPARSVHQQIRLRRSGFHRRRCGLAGQDGATSPPPGPQKGIKSIKPRITRTSAFAEAAMADKKIKPAISRIPRISRLKPLFFAPVAINFLNSLQCRVLQPFSPKITTFLKIL
jgi:hypothetical protein